MKQKAETLQMKRNQEKPCRTFLDQRETQKAIEFVRNYFIRQLSNRLNLNRVSAPIMVSSNSGLNDYLNGTEKPVRFRLRDQEDAAEIVQSLAKWKRDALYRYGFRKGEGLYTIMNAIRPDEQPDAIHSFYVDQWDWEMVIGRGDRNQTFLKNSVKKIYAAILETSLCLQDFFPSLLHFLPEEISFIHSEDLLKIYPDKTAREREDLICKKLGAVFVMGIGAFLANGKAHDGRAFDYDDWISETETGQQGLNGDILCWNPVLERSFELSSMGIRVNADSLKRQMALKGNQQQALSSYHQDILQDRLPDTIGGGIGQSRLCMLLLQKQHIGQVQAGLWPPQMIAELAANGIDLL